MQFVRLRTSLLKLFIGVIIFELAYFCSIGTMWLIPPIGMSIGAATGVANGGLMFQAFILFPFWAPLLASWATRRLSETEQAANTPSDGTRCPAPANGNVRSDDCGEQTFSLCVRAVMAR